MEQEELVKIVQNRMIAKRRGELVNDIEEAEREYRQGQCRVMTAKKFVDWIFS